MLKALRPRYLLLAVSVGVAAWYAISMRSPAHTASSGLSATTPTSSSSATKRRPVTVPAAPAASAEAVLGLVSSLPPDFQADVQLRMSNAPDLLAADASVQARRDVAKDLAIRAQSLAAQSARRMPGLGGVVVMKGIDELLPPRTHGLDQLSLQARAISRLSHESPGEVALGLAGLPRPKAATCDADYVDDPSAHFELLGRLWPEDAARRIAALKQRIDEAGHEVELLPALSVAADTSAVDTVHIAPVADSIARLFERARGDDASFTATELAIATQMQLVLQRLGDQPATREHLHQAYRDYVREHLQATRCASSLDGNHWLLEQRYVAELSPEQIKGPAESIAVRSSDAMPNDDAIAAIQLAGAAVRDLLFQQLQSKNANLSLDAAGHAFLDDIEKGAVGEAAAQDPSGRIARMQYRELLRYLEYAPSGSARDRGFVWLFQLLSDKRYLQDHDSWFGDITWLAQNAERWPDRTQRLDQMQKGYGDVLKTYALLMQRGQFP